MRILPPTILLLVAASAAQAAIIDSADGSGNTGPPPDDPGFTRVGRVWVASGVHIGLGRVVTANHVNLSDLIVGGVTYPAVPGSKVQLQRPGGAGLPPDIAVFRVDPYPDEPLLPIRSQSPQIGADATLIGRGRNRGPATSWESPLGELHEGYDWGSGKTIRWGTNQVSFLAPNLALGTTTETDCFAFEFTQFVGPDEAIAAAGDSGGGVFIRQGNTWQLAGVMLALGTFPDQPASTSLYGNVTYAADLSAYRDQILALLNPRCSDGVDNDGDTLVDLDDPGCFDAAQDFEDPECDDGADNDGDTFVDLADPECTDAWVDMEDADGDGDGVGDTSDNCSADANADQCDTDLDGYGNICDADYGNDGMVGVPDFALFKASWGTSGLGDCAHVADHNNDGAVGTPDFGLFKSSFGLPPGPSGLACAGSEPCSAP